MSYFVSSSSNSNAAQKPTISLCWGPANTVALALTAFTLCQVTSLAVGHVHMLPSISSTSVLLIKLQQQMAVGGEPTMILWQQLEQQRLGRLTKLLQALAPKPLAGSSAWGLLNLLLPKTAHTFSGTLSWYSSTQRPMYAATDLQQLLQASVVSDPIFEGDRVHIRGDQADDTIGFWSQITEHLGHSSAAASSVSKSHQAGAGSRTTPSQATAGSIFPQPTRHRRLAAAANSAGTGSSGSSSSGTKTTRSVTRAMPTGYVTSVTQDFSGISVEKDSSGSSSSGCGSSTGIGMPSAPAANGSQVLWPNTVQAGSMPSRAQQIPYRIIGGQEAPLNRFKWACSLRAQNDFHYCGCSLIAPSVVLTAAHCLDHPESDTLSKPWVEVGRYYLTGTNQTEGNDYDRIKCVKSVVHDGWSFKSGLNDIALCFLEDNSRFKPVNLAAANNDVTVGQQLTVMGWGAQTEGARNAPQLMEVSVNVVSTDTCNTAYKGAVRDTQICAGLPQGGADACQGDSGGPLFTEGSTAADDVQVGIVSYGVGCGRPNTPGVYTDVSKYRTFIKQQLLSNGVAYVPLTDNTPIPASATPVTAAAVTTTTTAQTTATSTKPKDSCACSVDGFSGSVDVQLIGCKQHGLDFGDSSYYCYAQGGTNCAKATASNAHPGAAWMDCDPKTQQSSKPGTTAPAVVATSNDPGSGTTDGTSSIAGSSSSNQKPAAAASLAAVALQVLQNWMFNAAALPNDSNGTAVRAAAILP